MPVILVANPKGGVGKSTLATNIAGGLAWRGHQVMLGDVDKQQSSRRWLAQRPAQLPWIQGWDFEGDLTVKPPKGVTHVVIDTPAGLDGKKLKALCKLADKIIIPLQPSMFDIQASFDFVRQLQEQEHKKHFPTLGLVGMRVKEGTLSLDQLQQFLPRMNVPLIGFLRDTQNYVQLAARGLTLWDVAPSRVERDLQQWSPLMTWLEQRDA
ncbi:ParA family protein [Roseateles koreensis]|uniref:ParA family protein n=1 Tax=Roseateles koreensis TaxID=2987526 RepID=A0ABT5KN16_9BURK|nr:ParA family protein [Roseateles koreensis]MDC8784303.1 ParA family protein [Roseateles koreensis]